MIPVNRLQVYVTHSCNLSCEHCLSFNNFRINGLYRWEHSRERILQWSQRITVEDMTIIGGEPLLHPDIDRWVCGVRECFPAVEDFKICTNGSLLGRTDPDLLRGWQRLGVILEVHCHSAVHWEQAWAVLLDLFPGAVCEQFTDRAALHSAEIRVEWQGRLLAIVRQSYRFLPNSVRTLGAAGLEFYHTDPVAAHRSCEIRDCHYLVDGLMYKCGVVAAGATAQGLRVEPRAAQLFRSYTPVDPLDPDLESAVSGLLDPAEVCSLCPVFGDLDDPARLVDIDPLAPRRRLR